MRHQKVKILSFFLAVFIAVASFPALKSNAAGGNIPNSNLTWNLDGNGKLTIEGTGAMPNWTSTASVPWYSSRSSIKTVEIKSGVTTIASYAFRSHGNLTSISIPNTVTTIGSYSFQLCGKLTSVTIPNSVTSIGSFAFTSCTTLSSLTLSSKLTEIGNDAFKTCKALTSVTIPSGVRTINNNTFNGCVALTSVSFPNSVTTIGNYAFNGCSKLKNVTLPSGLVTIGEAAFSNCSSFTSVSIPNGVNTIGTDAFAKCTSLTSVTLPDSILHIYGGAFRSCTSLSSINIPDGIIYIGDNTFGYCSALTTFSIPASVTTFGYDALGYSGVHDVNYYGTEEQWLNIDTLQPDGENWTMNDEFDKYGITVHFVSGSNDVKITTHPSDFTGKVGTTATFSVKAQGEGLTYQWFEFDGEDWSECNYTGWNTSTLSVSITCSKLGYKYGCEVTDRNGRSATSNNANLIIDSVPLRINRQPADFAGLAGETATFTVAAQGDELTYQWQVFKDGEWTNVSKDFGAKTNTLTLEIKDSLDGNKYHCVIKDGYGSKVTTNEVTLSLQIPLTISNQPTDVSCQLGSTATFNITATGTGLQYQWQVFANGSWTNCSNSGATSSTLSLEATADRNGLKYHCVVTDSKLQTVTSDVVTLTVIFPVEITTQPKNVSCQLGSTATFTVAATGNNISYQWQVLTNGNWINCSANDGANTPTLTLTATAARNGLKYHCVITDLYQGSVVSNDATLTVISPISITLQPKDYTGPVDEKARFKVTANGESLTYQWQYIKDGQWTNLGGSTAVTAEYAITIKDNLDGRKYRCVITDANNNVITTDTVVLHVDRPDLELAIKTQPKNFSGIIGDKAKFKVVAEGNGLTYQWQYYKNGEWINLSGNSALTAEYSITIKEALDGRKYHCVITDANNNTVTSNSAKLTVDRPYVELSISTQPKDYFGQVGDKAKFKVVAEGNGLTYQWQYKKDGQWVNLGGSTAVTAEYAITIKDSLDGRQYQCVITDEYNFTVTTATVTLSVQKQYVAPSIIRQPDNFMGVVGEKATYSVLATGTDLTYQWQYLAKDGQWVNLSGNAALTANYSITIKDSLNGRCYRCVITDSKNVSVTTLEVYLKVVEAPLSETSGFKNEIDLSSNNALAEPVAPSNTVATVEAENDVEESDVIETEAVEVIEPVIETTSEAEVTETVDEQVS